MGEQDNIWSAKDVLANNVIVLHYVREDYQMGFRAYEGLQLIDRTRQRFLPLLAMTDYEGRLQVVDYLTWDTTSSFMYSSDSGSKNVPPVIAVSDATSLSIFQFYNDPKRPDFFWVNPVSVEPASRDTYLSHYVIIKKEDLGRWNPNKFVFDVRTLARGICGDKILWARRTLGA